MCALLITKKHKFDNVRHAQLFQDLAETGLDTKDLLLLSELYWKQSATVRIEGNFSRSITACAIATNCCISDVPSQWQGQNFDPPLLPHFSTDLNET